MGRQLDLHKEQRGTGSQARISVRDRPDVGSLIHQPFGDCCGSWRAMQNLNRQGLARAIGVSNFYPDRLVDLIDHNEIVPAVNQIETHPFFQRTTDQEVMRERGVQTESWGPLGQGPARPVHQPGSDRDRRRARQDGRSGRAVLAHPAWHRGDPQAGAAGAHAREPRCLRLHP